MCNSSAQHKWSALAQFKILKKCFRIEVAVVSHLFDPIYAGKKCGVPRLSFKVSASRLNFGPHLLKVKKKISSQLKLWVFRERSWTGKLALGSLRLVQTLL